MVTLSCTCRERRSLPDGGKVWEVRFLRSPVEILGDGGRVGGVRLEINKLKVILCSRKFCGISTKFVITILCNTKSRSLWPQNYNYKQHFCLVLLLKKYIYNIYLSIYIYKLVHVSVTQCTFTIVTQSYTLYLISHQ